MRYFLRTMSLLPSFVVLYSVPHLATLTFQVEMEFVQSLANPNYLHFLAQRGFMKDPCFVNYLNYLTYWKVRDNVHGLVMTFSLVQEPAYVCFLKYPVCLHFLELLQHETFRKEIVSGQCARFLDDQVLDDLAFAIVKH